MRRCSEPHHTAGEAPLLRLLTPPNRLSAEAEASGHLPQKSCCGKERATSRHQTLEGRNLGADPNIGRWNQPYPPIQTQPPHSRVCSMTPHRTSLHASLHRIKRFTEGYLGQIKATRVIPVCSIDRKGGKNLLLNQVDVAKCICRSKCIRTIAQTKHAGGLNHIKRIHIFTILL